MLEPWMTIVVLRSMSIEWLKIGISNMYAVTQPRHLDSQESVKAATISFSILFCKNALHVEDLLLLLLLSSTHTYVSCRSIHPPTCAGKVLLRLSALVHICFPRNAHIRTGLVSITVSNQKVGEYASLLLVRQ